ncbi:phosphate starvation-inducible protein PhoH [Gracilimonas mengyeensis]|uniref:PhoH-like protein n=1 Tax=Gracilimonas mengyeensis TaxID=1302730 RepID=A0A521FIS4_9BACT|nr:PhoH family protein [Gracilimonas mengyeensis]SMO96113.1 phosphate starvation-inducible protein PhoH [Gracilimonas mengyeensis]
MLSCVVYYSSKNTTAIEDQKTLTEEIIELEGTDPVALFGLHDHNLIALDKAFPETKFNSRGNRIKLTGPAHEVETAANVVHGMIELLDRKSKVSEGDVKTLITLKSGESYANEPKIRSLDETEGDVIIHTHTGEAITAKKPGQKRIVESSAENDIVFAIGPAGTGKTYTSVALAVQALKNRKVRKIILARPAVEAGENLGFLPGDLKEKIDPYLRPLYDALEDMIDQDRLELNLAKNVIEIAPLAYMRGRTLNNAFVILDEAQNATNTQMKMFLTRIGFNSRAIITGDVTQTDLPRRQQSGLISIQNILKEVNGIDFVYLDDGDVVRHKLVRDIIKAYDRYEDEQNK